MRLIRGKELKGIAPYIFDGCKHRVEYSHVRLPICELYAPERIWDFHFLSTGLRYYAVVHTNAKLPKDYGALITTAPNGGLDVTPSFVPPEEGAVPSVLSAYFSVDRTQKVSPDTLLFAAYLFDFGNGGEGVEAMFAKGERPTEAVA